MHKCNAMACGCLLMMISLMVRADVSDPTRPLFFKTQKPAPVIKHERVVKPVIRAEEKPEVYRLTSTLVSQQRNIAVINDQVVSVGDKIGRAVVVAIKPAIVVLKSGNNEIELALAIEKVHKSWKRAASGKPAAGSNRSGQ